MAYFPIPVPQWWPDFKVTSYKRGSGSHATGYAVDITLDWSGDRSEKSSYWYYYFQTISWLWIRQRRGECRFAVPPNCPHYHLYSNAKLSYGYELITPVKVNGKWDCQLLRPEHLQKWSPQDFQKKYNEFISNPVISKYVHTWKNTQHIFFQATSKDEKRIYVNPNAQIDDKTLQSIIDSMYTEQYDTMIYDAIAREAGWDNYDDAKNAASSALKIAKYAFFAFVGLYVYNLFTRRS